MGRDLLGEIIKKKGNIKRPGLKVTLSRTKKRHDLRSIDQAACYYIKRHGLDINVSSVIDDVTRKAVQDYFRPPEDHGTQSLAKAATRRRTRIVGPADPFLDDGVVRAANSNVEIYPVVYLFENSVRTFVVRVMEKNFGTNWWTDKVHPKIQERVEIRRLAEKQAPWHSKRGADPIYYTDIGDLEKIMNTFSREFRKVLPKFDHAIVWIDEIEKTRNILAHNNRVAKKDMDRLKLFAHDWSECAKDVYERLK